jgi:hypothetical protein
MKKILYPMLISVFSFPFLVLGQQSGLVEVKCTDYSCNVNKAQTALANKQYKEAIDYCRAAKSYPNANISEADAILYKILESIVAQKKIAEGEKQDALLIQKKAIEDDQKALGALDKAKTDAEAATRKKDNADTAIKQADNDEMKANEAIKKADNDIELAVRLKEKAKLDITQAQNTKAKAKTALTLADAETQTAIELKKRTESEAEAAKREKLKADGIIANSEKASLAATNLVKEVSSALTGEEPKEEKMQATVASKSVEPTSKREANPNPSQGVIYVSSKSAESKPSKKIDVAILQKAIDAEKNKLKSYSLQNKLIDSLETWYQQDASYRSDLAENYANKAWSALFLKKYNESEQACHKGIATDDSKLFIKAILGHAYLFQDKYEQALDIYTDFLKDPKQHKTKSNRNLIFEDLDVLKQEGITHKDVLKVKAVLVNEKKVK